MAFDFPAAPTIGQTYTPSTGITYVWTGACWDRVAPTGIAVMPAGVIMAFGGTTPPPGALLCNGAAFNPAVYPALAAVLGSSNTPDLRGRVIVGLDTQVAGSFANRVTNAGVGNPGLDSKTMKATGGFDRFTLAAVNIPAHTHDGSGTTSLVSSDHAHGGTTVGENVDHAHYVSGYTAVDGSHRHTYDRYTSVAPVTQTVTTANQSRNNDSNWTGYDGGHQHSMNFWSGGRNTGHTHSFGTGGISANHTHTYSFTSTSFGGGEAHPILQPSIVLNFIIFTGATA